MISLVGLEFMGMLTTMVGSYLVTRNKEKFMLYGSYSFLLTNYALFAFATGMRMFPLQIQVIALFITTLPTIKTYSNENWDYIKIIILKITTVYILILLLFFNFKINIYDISKIEIFAAILIITGSFLLKNKSNIMKISAFSLFIIGDSIYVYISVEKHLLFFGIQSIFVIITYIDGIKKEIGEKKVVFYKGF